MGFYREAPIKAVRKARQCCGCGVVIEVGLPALSCAGRNDDGFWEGTYHPDCRAAENALNDLKDYRCGDDWYSLWEIEFDDWEWLMAEFPTVAERMKITPDRHTEAVTRYASFWTRTAQGMETRQGGDGTSPSQRDDSPVACDAPLTPENPND